MGMGTRGARYMYRLVSVCQICFRWNWKGEHGHISTVLPCLLRCLRWKRAARHLPTLLSTSLSVTMRTEARCGRDCQGGRRAAKTEAGTRRDQKNMPAPCGRLVRPVLALIHYDWLGSAQC